MKNMKTFNQLFEDLQTDYDRHYNLTEIREMVKKISGILSLITYLDDEVYTSLMLEIEKEFGEDVSYVIDHCGGDLNVISERIHDGQKGNQLIDYNLFLTNFDKIKVWIEEKINTLKN